VDPIVQLEGWRQGLAGRRLAARLHAWAEREPALHRFGGEPEALFRFLRTPPTAERDQVFCALLEQAKEDELAGLVVLEALVPGLKALARRLLVEPGQRDEVWAVILACCWERIRRYPIERRPSRVAANLLLDTRHASLRALGRRPDEPPTVPLEESRAAFEQKAPEQHADVIAVLRRAVKAEAITAEEAQLILYTRIDRADLHALADEQQVAYHTLVVRRLRAERRLLLFLGKPAVTSKGRNRHICTARTDAVSAAE
jgi:DNA-directed RNA polymerase specialized sigma24 family protein